MRITMRMISQQYSKNLNNSLSQLNSAYNKGTTYRKFDKVSEDPFSAAKAYRLRREFVENDTYQSNVSDASDQLTTAQSAMMSIHTIVSSASTGDTIQAITGTMSKEDRATVATKLRTLQQAILAPSNTKFGDKYLFGGSEMTDPPFTIGSDGTTLLYRGVDVNTGKIENGTTTSINGAKIQFGKDAGTTFNGYTITAVSASGNTGTVDVDDSAKTITVQLDSGATNQDLINALKGASGTASPNGTAYNFSNMTMTGDLNRPVATSSTEPGYASNVTKDTLSSDEMASLASEQSLVDLGMGLRLNADGTINSQSAFDQAIPGISFMGYGTTKVDGTEVSNNLYNLLGQISDQLESDDFSIDTIKPYLTNFSTQVSNLMGKITESGTKSNFLTTTKSNLETMGTAITEKDQNVEFIDPGTAIENYYMQQFAYNAALAMGTKIVSKSFLDFMT